MKTALSAIQSLFKTAIKQPTSPLYGVKEVFFGDPITIPEASLPALTIQPISTDFVQRGSRYDQKNHTIEIRLVYNQKQYFGKNLSSAKTVTGAFWVSDEITFTVANHGLSVGSSVVVSGCSPDRFDGTFAVKAVSDSNTFVVSKSANPGTYVSGGSLQTATNDKVFAIEDAIAKVEDSDVDHGTEEFTVCGTIQKNPSLPYVDAGGIERNAAELAKVRSVNYSFSENRGFPTFEVVTTIEVTAIGDR